MSDKILIKVDRLWDGLSPDILHNAYLLVDNGLITAFGRWEDRGSQELGGFDMYDLGDTTLMPGLINLHTHLTFNAAETTLEDYFKEKAAGIVTLTVRAVDNLQRSLKAGVTTIRDCGTLNEVVFGVRAAVESGLLAGPRIIASGHGITTTGGHCYYFSHEADTVEEVRKAVRTQVKAGADFIKLFSTGGGLTPGTNPVEAQYSEAEMKAGTAEAKRLGRKVSSHAHGVDGVRNSIAAGVDTIEHCTFMTYGGVEYDQRMADQIAEKGIFVVPTLSYGFSRRLTANPNLLQDNPGLARFARTSVQRAQNLKSLFDSGVVLVSGSDSGIPGVPFEDFPLDLSLLVKNVGLTPFQALQTATSLAAKAMGLTDTGVLAPGKRADLLAVDGNPLEQIEDLQLPRFVMARGKLAHANFKENAQSMSIVWT